MYMQQATNTNTRWLMHKPTVRSHVARAKDLNEGKSTYTCNCRFELLTILEKEVTFGLPILILFCVCFVLWVSWLLYLQTCMNFKINLLGTATFLVVKLHGQCPSSIYYCVI